VLADLGGTVVLSQGIGVKGYLWERSDFDHIPAVVVEPPDGTRRDIDEGESQLSTTDWLLDYTVRLYVDFDEFVRASEQMTELLEAFVQAIDSDPSLGRDELDCKLVSWEKFVRDTPKRRLAGYVCTVRVYHLEPDPEL
jgi:hypothetical protein